jgi:hypothetical protein
MLILGKISREIGMKTVISVASVFACALSLDAQITTTLTRLSDGSTEIKIRNTSAVSLTTFMISANVIRANHAARSTPDDNAPFVAYYDPAIDPTTEPLLPKQERVLPRVSIICAPAPRNLANVLRDEEEKRRESLPLNWAGAAVEICDLEQPITAGILADGSTIGDAGLLARLLLRRSNMLLAVETALETLSDAGRRNVPRDQLIAQFKRMAESVRRWYLPPEEQVGSSVYQAIVGKLVNLPDEQVGSPFPPNGFVAQETGMLNRQRVILMGYETQPGGRF